MYFSSISKINTFTKLTQILSIITLSTGFMACQSFQSQSDNEERNNAALKSRISISADLIDRGQAATALADLRALLIEQPDAPDVLTMNAIAHLALSNYKQALALQTRAYKLENSTAMGVTLAGIMIVNDKLDAAEKLLLKLGEDAAYSFPERILQNLGLIYEKKGKFNLAISQFKKALSFNPTYFPAMNLLGRVYEKTGNQANATLVYRNAAQICPACFEPINLLFQQMILKNSHQEAISLVDAYLKGSDLLPENRTLALQLKKRAEALGQKQATMENRGHPKGG